MINVKKIKPVFTGMLVSARKYEKDVIDHGVTIITAGTLMEYQEVIAIGDSVRRVKEGDLIKVNPKRYMVKKYDKNSVREDMDMNPTIRFDFNIITLEGIDYILLDECDIEYIIEDYEELENKPNNIILPDNKIIV